MFGTTVHDIASGVIGNAVYYWLALALALLVRRVTANIKSTGAGRIIIRGMWSAVLLFFVTVSGLFAAYVHQGRGFNNGVWFVVSLLNLGCYFCYYVAFNKNWIEPAADNLFGWLQHILDIARPDYKPPDTAPDAPSDTARALDAPAIQSLIDDLDIDYPSPEGNCAISRVVDAGEAAVQPLIEALHHPRRQVRTNVAFALGRTKDERAIQPLIESMSDDDPTTAIAAAMAIGEIGRAALPHLQDVWNQEARSNDREAIRRGVTRALGFAGDVQAVEMLEDFLKEWEETTRKTDYDLFGVAGTLIGEHRALIHTGLEAEARRAESQRLLTATHNWNAEVAKYVDFRRWSTPLNIGMALASTAKRSLTKVTAPSK